MLLGNKKISTVNIIMIVIALALIATAAVPSYVSSHSTKDNTRSVDSVAGALGSASAINYAVRNISHDYGIAITNCADVVRALEGSLDNKYTVLSEPVKGGSKTNCTVTDNSGNKATFVAQGTQ